MFLHSNDLTSFVTSINLDTSNPALFAMRRVALNPLANGLLMPSHYCGMYNGRHAEVLSRASLKQLLGPQTFRGEWPIKEGAGPGNGGDGNRVWGQRAQAEAETGDRDGTMLRAGPTDRDGGGRLRTKHQEDRDEQRTEGGENRWLKKGKRKEERPQSGENRCLRQMHMVHCKEKLQCHKQIDNLI